MSDRPTTMAHHPSCIASQAWDIQEAYDHCSCPAFWPHRVCTECWQIPKRHARDCSRRAELASLGGKGE